MWLILLTGWTLDLKLGDLGLGSSFTINSSDFSVFICKMTGWTKISKYKCAKTQLLILFSKTKFHVFLKYV